jgi:hypothetical protein
VLCVGNSLAHAVGRSGRRAAIEGMAFVLATGGVLALTSRNWEQIRSAGSRLDVWDRLVERAARKAVVVYSWQVPPSWETEHRLQISVAALHDGDRLQVTTELALPSRGTPSRCRGRRSEPRRVHVRRDPTGVSPHRPATRRVTDLTPILVIRGRMTRCPRHDRMLSDRLLG